MADVLVVGAGIVGLLTALELTDRGRRVTVIDAPDHFPPASWAGGGILSPLHAWRYPDAMTRLTHDAPARYRTLMERLHGHAGLRGDDLSDSGLWVAVPETAERGRAVAWAGRWGLPCEARDLADHCAGADSAPGLWFPSLGNLRNPRILKALKEYLGERGVAFIEGRVQRVGEGEAVLSGDRTLRAGTVLISAGAWSASLLSPLGVSLPLFPAKGEMLLYRLAPGQVPSVLLTEEGYLIPRADGAVLAGSTLREGDDSHQPTEAGRRQLMAMAGRLLPALAGVEPAHHWAGVRPGSDRDWPYLGPVPGHAGVFAAVGHHRNGLVSAPASAAFMARLICGEPAGLPVADYALPG